MKIYISILFLFIIFVGTAFAGPPGWVSTELSVGPAILTGSKLIKDRWHSGWNANCGISINLSFRSTLIAKYEYSRFGRDLEDIQEYDGGGLKTTMLGIDYMYTPPYDRNHRLYPFGFVGLGTVKTVVVGLTHQRIPVEREISSRDLYVNGGIGLEYWLNLRLNVYLMFKYTYVDASKTRSIAFTPITMGIRSAVFKPKIGRVLMPRKSAYFGFGVVASANDLSSHYDGLPLISIGISFKSSDNVEFMPQVRFHSVSQKKMGSPNKQSGLVGIETIFTAGTAASRSRFFTSIGSGAVIERNENTAPYIDIGGGIKFSINDNLSMFFRLDYTIIANDGSNGNLMPVRFGLIIH